MRKLVAGFASSLDGYIEGPNGEYDWIVIDKEINFAEQAKRFDAYFYGRNTYKAVRKMGGGAPKKDTHYVFSSTLNAVAKGFVLLNGNIREEVMALKQQPGKDIAVFGGAALLTSLLNEALVDELSIAIMPVLLGSGKLMVTTQTNRTWISLTDTKTYSNGTVQLTYAVNKSES